jgi:hypothetical protein
VKLESDFISGFIECGSLAGQTALLCASRRGHQRMVLELLYYGATVNINQPNSRTGDTAIHGMLGDWLFASFVNYFMNIIFVYRLILFIYLFNYIIFNYIIHLLFFIYLFNLFFIHSFFIVSTYYHYCII